VDKIPHNPLVRTMRLKLSKPQQKTLEPEEQATQSHEELSNLNGKPSNLDEKGLKSDEKLTSTNKKLSKPDKRFSKSVQDDPKAPYSYPVDIRLDSAAPHMWIRRLFGRVDGVRVYTGPLAKL